MTVKAVDYRESNSSASFEPGDFCLYAFGKENKSKAVVEVVKVLDDPRGVAQVKFHRVMADDTGNGLFNYLRRTGNTIFQSTPPVWAETAKETIFSSLKHLYYNIFYRKKQENSM